MDFIVSTQIPLPSSLQVENQHYIRFKSFLDRVVEARKAMIGIFLIANIITTVIVVIIINQACVLLAQACYWQTVPLKNVKLTHNSTPDGNDWARKVCDMILFIGGLVDWEGGPVDCRT